MEPIFVLAIIFGAISLWIRMGHAHKEKMAELEAKKQQLRMLPPGSAGTQDSQLDQRLQHLESIICSVDFELNAKLNRLATQQLLGLPEGSGAAPVSADAATKLVSRSDVRSPLSGVQPGLRLADRYVIEGVLGHGGMGSVFRARDEKLGESVALKIISGFSLMDPAAADRMRREVSTARRISHPNVVRIHDIGESQGVLFLSMEYVPGVNLADTLSRHGRLPLAQIRELFSQICDGLEAAHAVGIVHRDLKPGNILIGEGQRIKIIDFGIALAAHSEGMTSTGVILGTPEYMAPEQVRGTTVDARADIYALGAVLYHALCGRAPFQRPTPIAISLAHLNDAPEPPRSVLADIPEAWEAVALRALAKDPAHRFDSVRAFRDALPIA